ncbi:hypothetical protein OMAG_001245 [Candidatus Omnitrophus magneticus]|uniref:Uncharacterized protein n=1 Tax=Candidatus Omnitrophus magneticus TaxID=1609969 RepID=A0A0F0CSA1_9BACT|nr:hypothetical protein OMAG_001245 [Candidatus Omnitrophus magneticus]
MKNPGQITLWGIEDVLAYQDNLNLYKDFLTYKDDAVKLLNPLENLLNNLKLHIYTKDLLKFSQEKENYKNCQTNLKTYIKTLCLRAVQNKISITEFKNILAFNQSTKYEEEINIGNIKTEKNNLINELLNKLSYTETQELIKKTITVNNGLLSQEEFYGLLLTKASELKIDLKNFKSLSTYKEYGELRAEFNSIEIQNEISNLEIKIENKLYTNEHQKTLSSLYRKLEIIKNMFNLIAVATITNEESGEGDNYKDYRDNKNIFSIDDYITFIKNTAPSYGINIESNLEELKHLDKYAKNIYELYYSYFRRSEYFLKNINYGFNNKSDRALLITDKIHTNNLAGIMREKNISYISIRPNVKIKQVSPAANEQIASSPDTNTMNKFSQYPRTDFLSNLEKNILGNKNIDSYIDTIRMIDILKKQNSLSLNNTYMQNNSSIKNTPKKIAIELTRAGTITSKETNFKPTGDTIQKDIIKTPLNDKITKQALSIAQHLFTDITNNKMIKNSPLFLKKYKIENKLEIIVSGLKNEGLSKSYMKNDGTFVIVINNNRDMYHDILNNARILAELICHELMKSIVNMPINEIKQVEILRNNSSLTLLNQIELKSMTIEELHNIQPNPETDPNNIYFNASRLEIIIRQAKNLLNTVRPNNPIAILLYATEKQLAQEYYIRQIIQKEITKTLAKKYGSNIKIYYYTSGSQKSLDEQKEKALSDKEFNSNENSRLIIYATSEINEEYLKKLNEEKKIAGIIMENSEKEMPNEEVFRVILGIGIADYSLSARTDVKFNIKTLLETMLKKNGLKNTIEINIEKIIKGSFILKLKKINYEGISDWAKTQYGILRSL